MEVKVWVQSYIISYGIPFKHSRIVPAERFRCEDVLAHEQNKMQHEELFWKSCII